jgi:two-component system OmpR family sensor kinase
MMRSIERSLLIWLLGALGLGAVVLALSTYLVTLDEMNEVYDAELKNVATAMAAFDRAGVRARLPVPPPPSHELALELAEIVTVIWTRDGHRVFASNPAIALPFTAQEGVVRTRVAGEEWIVYTHPGPDAVAQVAQRSSGRHEAAVESASKILLPMLLLGTVLAGLLVFALRRGLKPLDATGREIALRSATSLVPVDVDEVPREIRPLVESINDLMGRLSFAFSGQQRFVADAAHELRTPVTALRLQLQLLERAGDEASRADAMRELAAGIQRTQRLIQQLLQVTRYEPGGDRGRFERVDLAALVRTTVGAMSAKADEAGIDLGAAAAQAVAIDGDAAQLEVMVSNLIENALRYTPAGGVVDVTVRSEHGRAVLQVIDNGPGIPEAEREHVFERFYRTRTAPLLAQDAGGSGLGLAIVRSIAQRHGASVALLTPAGGTGLEVRVVFALPLAPPEPDTPEH